MSRLFNKEPELDPEEMLPFCTRCFNIGLCAEEDGHNNFCHMCGSQNTCVPIKRKYASYLMDNIQYELEHWYKTGIKKGKEEAGQ